MSLFLKKSIQDASIGIWEIKESVEELYGRIKLSYEEEKVFSSLKTPTRKQHWLSYRMILPYLVSDHELSAISYDRYGKPFLDNGVRHISVSHSGKYSALIASPVHSVGVDIERIEKKIERLSHKFLTEQELAEGGRDLSLEALYVMWAAKETLFKLHGKRDILFKDHIYVAPFAPEKEGLVYGTIKSDDGEKMYTVHYQLFEDYVLSYAVDRSKFSYL